MRTLVYSLIGLNLLLAASLGVMWTRRGPAASVPSVQEPTVQVESAASAAPTKASSGPQRPVTPEKFSWTALASPDLQKYAANLRRVGCPEPTIKDIMMAEVNRLYGPRERALKVRPDDIAPWEQQGTFNRYSSETKLRQLLEEKRNLLRDLVGVDVGIDMPKRLAGRDQDRFEGAFAALPDAKRDQVRAIQENYWAQSDDIKQRTLGYLEPEDRAEFQRIKNERHDALAKVMTPDELQNYEMATSEDTSKLRSKLQGVKVSDDEFRKIFDLVQPLDEQFSLNRKNPDPLDQEFTAARADAEKQVEQNLRSVLGDERFAEYERLKDPAYKAISQAGQEAGLSQDTILQAYNAQREMRDTAQKTLADPNLTPEQRAQTLSDMRVQAQQRFEQLFGDKAPQLLKRLPDVRLVERLGVNVMPGVPERAAAGATLIQVHP